MVAYHGTIRELFQRTNDIAITFVLPAFTRGEILNWVFTIGLCIVLVEFLTRIPVREILEGLMSVLHKTVYVVSSRHISEHRKEKVMLIYAGSIMKSTVLMALVLLAVGLIAAILIYSFDYFGHSTGKFMMSWTGILFSIFAAFAYWKIRGFFV